MNATRRGTNLVTAPKIPAPSGDISPCRPAKRIRWEKNHGKKADLAAELFGRGEVTTNIRSLLGHLNDVRKDISYEEPGPELADMDLEELVGELEEYLGEVDALIDKVEQSE